MVGATPAPHTRVQYSDPRWLRLDALALLLEYAHTEQLPDLAWILSPLDIPARHLPILGEVDPQLSGPAASAALVRWTEALRRHPDYTELGRFPTLLPDGSQHLQVSFHRSFDGTDLTSNVLLSAYIDPQAGGGR